VSNRNKSDNYYEQIGEDFIEKYAQAIYQLELGEISEATADINLMVSSRAFPDEELLKEAGPVDWTARQFGKLVGSRPLRAVDRLYAGGGTTLGKKVGYLQRKGIQARGAERGLSKEQIQGVINRIELGGKNKEMFGKGYLRSQGVKNPTDTARYVAGVRKTTKTAPKDAAAGVAPSADEAAGSTGRWANMSTGAKAAVLGGGGLLTGTGIGAGAYYAGKGSRKNMNQSAG
jgi:hypothetical protein